MRTARDDRQAAGLGLVETIALLGTLALIASPAVKGIGRRWRVRNPLALRESAIDESLKGTFPASDPPAQRYVDIPANRR
jgi:hypothetical protein